MRPSRARALADVVGVVLCELALLVFFWKAAVLFGSVDVGHLVTWAQQSSPVAALTALVRLLGICVSTWLLVSTAVYGVGALTGSRRLLERSRLVTPARVRRVLDTLAAASVAASSIGSMATMAGASAVPHVALVARPADSPPPPGRVASKTMAPSGAPPRVSATALGRHFPHPGEVPHGLPAATPADLDDVRAPSPENGFAGLQAGTKVVVVRPGDCLSVLAERHLGDWRLDTEIEALNHGRLQADGRALVDDHWIYPGWVLVMPANAVGATVVVGGTPAPRPAKVGLGLQGPSVPTPAAPAHKPAPAAPVSIGGPAPVAHIPTRRPVPVASPLPTPASPLPTPASPLPTPASPLPTPAPGTAAQNVPDSSKVRKGHDDAVAALAIGAVAAAGALWRLDGMRRELRHDRPRGSVISRNKATVEAAERRSRAIADGEAMRWVDLGLRYLSGMVEQLASDDHEDIPSVVLVKVGKGGLEVVLSARPKGRLGWFAPTADGAGLVLDSDLEIEDLELLAADRWPAWPVVVSLGESDGGTVLMNLEHAGCLSVEGEAGAVRGALAVILLQLVSQPWSQEMLAGLYSVGEPTLDGRLAAVQQVGPDEALELAEKLDGIAGARQDLAGDLSLSVLRAVACEALPNVVVAFAGTPAGAQQCLAEAAVPERSGVVLVGAGPVPGARWRLTVGAGAGSLEGDVGGRPVSWNLRTGWDLEEVALVAEALASATDREAVMVDAAMVVAAPVLPTGSDARADVEILVLGPVDLAGGEMGAVEPSRRMAALGLLAYMASHDRPVTADQLGGALWPLDATRDNVAGPQRKTVMNVISRARAVLGYGPGGHERLVHSPQGYRLSADVSSDWSRFERLVSDARSQPPQQAMAQLRRALELVRGEPFSGALSSQFFEWVASEHLDLTLSAKIVDVAQDLGELALEADDHETVVWAVEKGLLLEPTREEMFRLWMHALGRQGRSGRVDDVYRRLKLVLRQRIHPLQEPQAESYAVWRSYMAGELAGASG